MSEVRPWEESPDDGYWRMELGAQAKGANTPSANVPSANAAGANTAGPVAEANAADANAVGADTVDIVEAQHLPPQQAAPQNPAAVEAQNLAPQPSSAGWALAESSFANGDILELTVVGRNRGGLLVDLGDIRGFVPSSQLSAFPRQTTEQERMQALAQFQGSVLKLKIIELDRARNRLILSERLVNPPVSHAEQLLATIQPQEMRKGVVRNITDFGAFVDLGGVEGLVHVSELSWQYVKHPRDVLTPGQEVQVYVMEVNREQKRIACSLKRLTSNPWTLAAEKLHPGDTIEGTITGKVDFGVFVRVADGVEGLVHISEMGNGYRNSSDDPQPGQTVQVRVIEIDPNQQRLRLSLRLNDSPSQRSRRSDRTNAPRRSVPPPPPPDPGYWDSLVQSGM